MGLYTTVYATARPLPAAVDFEYEDIEYFDCECEYDYGAERGEFVLAKLFYHWKWEYGIDWWMEQLYWKKDGKGYPELGFNGRTMKLIRMDIVRLEQAILGDELHANPNKLDRVMKYRKSEQQFLYNMGFISAAYDKLNAGLNIFYENCW